MSAAVLETLVWTGALITLVLLLRRPVARAFGPQYAYALWVLPVLRLVLPPLTLPAWMAPDGMAPAAPAPAGPPPWTQAGQAEAVPASVAFTTPPPAEPAFDPFAFIDSLPLAEAALLVWLGGAVVFLCRRFAAYFELREQLLAQAREVGSAPGPLGAIRLVETSGTAAPLAFGVLDPVIALPPGFMALHDRRARDLALAHELAHHRGLDLLVNVLVQPLFALHWFTPLGTYGWLALRRDQEAACDARVIARAGAEERAAYARLIAGFAAGPNLALAAPMACPVLGEKSIIERLRSLTMSQMSPRRRFAGRALLGLGVLALPLTASISYAAAEAAQEVPEPPAPPSPPEAPEPPQAPEPPESREIEAILMVDPDAPESADEKVEVIERVIREDDGKERRIRMVFRGRPEGDTPHEKLRGPEGIEWEGHGEAMKALREGLAEADRALADMPRIIEEARASAEAARAAGADAPRVIVMKNCDGDMAEPVTEKDGGKTILFCQSRVFASARKGLEEARAEIAADKDIPEETRQQILKSLDRSIARWRDKEG